MGEVPDPTDADRALLVEIAHNTLGSDCTAEFLGVRVKGIKGDEAHYGHAIILTIPPGSYDQLVARFDNFTHEVHGRIVCAGNVVVDVLAASAPRTEASDG